MNLWWSLDSDGGHIADPEWSDIVANLNAVAACSGIVELECASKSAQMRSLQLRVDGGWYVLTQGEESADGWLFRTLRATTADGTSAEVCGETPNAARISNELDSVVAAFHAFFLTGTAQRTHAG